MADSNDPPRDDPTELIFRRPFARWLVAGAVAVVVAAAYNGSPLHPALEKITGPVVANSITLAIGATGALTMLIGAFLLTEHTTVSEAGIEQYNLGRPGLRVLWHQVIRVTLYKHPKKPKGPIELLSGESRTMRLDPNLMRFDELEAIILDRVMSYTPDVRDHR